MPFYEEPNRAPFFASEVTREDSDALSSFLRARCDELLARHPVGSEEHRAARALGMATGAQIDELNCWFEDQEPETLLRRLQAWNYVVFSVWPWEGHSDFTPQRWRLVEHVDAEAALAAAHSDVKQLEEEIQKSRTAQ